MVGLCLALIISATLIAYLPAFGAGFIWNDNTYVHQNPLLAVPSLSNLGKIWSLRYVNRADSQEYLAPYTEQYYPMVFSSFWLESHLWSNTNPTGFHIVNILLHIANALLVWLICRRLGFAWGFLAGLLFALHPVAVESVAWITERKNVLSALFYLLALLSYLRFDRTGRRLFYFAALVCFVLALLSKTVTCTLPGILLLILYLRRRRMPWQDALCLIPFFIIGAGLGIFTAYLERNSVGAAGAEWQIAFWQRCVIAGQALFFYLAKLLWPVNLTFIYPRWDPETFSPLALLWPGSALLLTVALWSWRKKISPVPLLAWTCFIITLFPALGFIDVYPFRYSFVADHFQYLASMFPIALFVGLAYRLYKRFHPQPFSFTNFPSIPAMLTATVVLALTAMSYRQAASYKDAKTLWQDTTGKNAQAWMAWSNLGTIYRQERKFPQARKCFQNFLRLRPDYAPAQANYGQLLALQGRLRSAIPYFRQAIELRPEYVWAHLNLANVYAQLRQFELAESAYLETIKLAHDSPLAPDRRQRRIQAFSNLAAVYAETRQYPLAVRSAQRALDFARAYGRHDLTQEIEVRLQRYRHHLDEK